MGYFFLMALHLIFLLLFLFFSRKIEEILLEINFLSLSSTSLSFHLIIDIFSLIFLSFILLISLVVIYYRLFYIDGNLTNVRFLVLVFLFVGSMGLLVLSLSVLG